MRQVQLAIFAGSFVLILSLLQTLLLRTLNTVWWRRKYVRRVSWGLVVTTLVASGLWAVFVYVRYTSLAYAFAMVVTLMAVFNLALVLALPCSGVINTVQHWIVRRRQKRGLEENIPPKSLTRRVAMQRAAAIFPVSSLIVGTDGLVKSYAGCRIPEITFYYDDLPNDLDGFKILHVSDTHLGPYIDNDDLAALMIKAEPLKPDLLLVSGDVADDLDMLPEAIKLFEGLKAPYGAFACMGNHDYYRGAPQVKAQFDQSSVPMLISKGLTLKVGSAELYVGGADDPRYMGRSIADFMTETIDKTLDGAPSESFKLIMTHRPSGFDRAAEQGVQLTLAGHTHGGQIGLMGRSLFSIWGGEKYIWGHYSKDKSQHYTSSGVGHWFPFRLGCPTEAPLITLKKGVKGSIAAKAAPTEIELDFPK